MTKRFGRVVIAEDLSFAVGPGDTVGIVGPNGAGKTSLFGLISGDLSPGAGTDRLRRAPGDQAGRGGPVPARHRATYQVPRPFTDMTVFENVLVAAQQGGGLRRRASYGAAVQALERAGMTGEANLPAARLGLLQRKRLELARALASGPEPAAAGRGGGRPDRPGGRPAGRDRPRRQRRGHRGDLDRARGARAHRRGRPADLPGRRSFVGDGSPAAVLANPAVREVFLGSELTASLSGGTLPRRSATRERRHERAGDRAGRPDGDTPLLEVLT